MSKVKPPCVAGYFYPASKEVLQQEIKHYLSEAKPTELDIPPKAIIAPHAGYQYSGPVAASVYAYIPSIKQQVRKVILLGPAHGVPFRGIAATHMDYFQTPLGNIPIDHDSIQKILKLDGVELFDGAYEQEHSLEVHLPFLQQVLDNFTLVPLVVGDAPYQLVSEVLEILWGKEETLIVVSSDLSHFHDYEVASGMDAKASEAIQQLTPEKLTFDNACGRIPVQGLLMSAKSHQLKATVIDVRNSGDTAGNKERVVGYGAYHFG